MLKFLKDLYHSTIMQMIISAIFIIIFAVIYNLATPFSLLENIGYYGFLISFLPLVVIFIKAFYYGIKNTIKDIME